MGLWLKVGIINRRVLIGERARRALSAPFQTVADFPYLESFFLHHFLFLESYNLCIYNFFHITIR